MDDGPNASDSALASLFHPGDVIGGRFTLLRELGKSRARVWLADQTANPSWPHSVAIKLIAKPSDEDAKRLKEENRLCQALKDLACISRSFEYGECTVRGVRVVYMAREFVDGQDILKYANEKALTIKARVELMIKVCEGVDTLHARRTGHRDLKPANILIDTNGQPKMIDLGSAIDFRARQKVAPTIVTQAIHRTPGYAPPEAFGDDAQTAFTIHYEQWDVYSLGIVLADLLTGIRDNGRTPTELTPDVENDLETHDTLRHMAESLSAAEREQAATVRGFSSPEQWLAAFDPLLENVSLKTRHDSRSERYPSAAKLTDHLRDWQSKSAEQRFSEPPLKLNKRARQVSLDEQQRYLAMITGVASLIRERRFTRARDLLKDIDKGVGGDRSKHTRTWEYRHFDVLLNHLATVIRHDAPVNWAEFSPDGTRIVTASEDGSASVWDAATGALCAGPMKHHGPVNSATFSIDCTRIVTTSDDTTARVWDAATGAPLSEPMRHEERVNSATFSTDGMRIVTASDDHTARVWDITTGATLTTLKGHTEGVNSAEFTPAGTRVVTAGQDATARVWDAASGRELTSPLQHPRGFQELESVYSAHVSKDGLNIVTAYGDGAARVWKLDGTPVATLTGHDEHSQVLSAQFSRDGTRVVTASTDTSARVWDLVCGRLSAILLGHREAVMCAAFNLEGTQVVTASFDGTARVWDAVDVEARRGFGSDGPRLRELTVLRGHEGPVLSASFSPDDKHVLTVGRDDMTVRVWNGSEVDTLYLHEHPEGLQCMRAALSPDGRWMLIVHRGDHAVGMYDAATGLPHDKFSGNTAYSAKCAAFNHDGTRVVTCSGDGVAQVWHASTGAEQLILDPVRNELAEELLGRPDTTPAHEWERDTENWVHVAAFSQRGDRVATVHADRVAHVWDAASGTKVATLTGHDLGLIQCVAFSSPESGHVATASTDGTARVWDAASGKQLAVLPGHLETVNCVAFSPSGKRVVTASSDKTACVWDWVKEERIAVLRGHGHAVKHACFSSDGTRILTVSNDGGSAEREPASVRLWHADTGTELATLDHPGVVYAAFTDEGRRIVTVSSDGSVRTWHTQAPQERVAHLAVERARAAAQTVLHGAEARLSRAKAEPPSSEEVLREAEKDPYATPEVLAEVERMLRDRQRPT